MIKGMRCMSVAATTLASLLLACASLSAPANAQTNSTRSKTMTATNTMTTAPEAERRLRPEDIRPFRVNISTQEINNLRRRIEATRWADKETVADASQGVQLATLKELARYWSTTYDWRKVQARLNALPQFVTKIDGVDIHFIHVRSRYPNALPIIVTHGWPGSIIEQLKIIGPLTDPPANGGRAEDAFDVVIPSLPGYGFSAKPTEPGWNPARIGKAWDVLMKRLGYTRYVAQGGDIGAFVSDAMARLALNGLLGIHINLYSGGPPELRAGIASGAPAPSTLSEEEKEDYLRRQRLLATGFGYFIEQANRPQTIGQSLSDSPIGLASWMIDHDAISYGYISKLFLEQKPFGAITRDDILDNITLYWLTNTGTSSARLYWETARAAAAAAGKPMPDVTVPVAFSAFPEEVVGAPRSWLERTYPKLAYYNKVERGGHFAAWEQPELFAAEVRAAFKPVR
jgi:pimeloyl-ACP methyl ester carboxylesterase